MELKSNTVDNAIKTDFEFLIKKGNIAFYNTAEISNIYLIKESKSINLFSLVVFEENKLTSKRSNITPTLQRINKDISLGISQKRVNIDEAKSFFLNIFDSIVENDYNSLNMEEGPFYIEKFKIIPKQFIPSSRSVPVINSIPLNEILKNNNENGSYTIEFFSEDKKTLNLLSQAEYKKVCSIVSNYLPIDLSFLNERSCNIIFQFPITSITVKTKPVDNRDKLQVKIGYHPLLNKKKLNYFASTFLDGNIMGNVSCYGISKNEVVNIGNIDGETTELVKDSENDIILWYSKGFYVREAEINKNLNTLDEPRTISIDDKNYEIKLKSSENELIGFRNSYAHQIYDREYIESKNKLIKRKEFLQYGINGVNESITALNDLREIIKRNCDEGVYLWDPYARSHDLLKTIYHCPYSKCELKVITSYSKETRNKIDDSMSELEDWKIGQIGLLKSCSNNNNLNLEIRYQIGDKGWKFHDRFIIFPQVPPRVWSLGTSVNSIGKSHSILMKIENAQNVLDAFNELWNELESSILWKYPEDDNAD